MPADAGTGEHDFAAVITLEMMFRTEMDFVMNIARRCGLGDADAEDVVQKVFLQLQRRLHSLSAPESIRPWLATVTRRTAWAHRGARRREPDEPMPYDLTDIEDDAPLPEELMMASERRRQLLELIETIEPSRRIVLVMHVLDELPVPEVAEALRIPIPTAYNRLRLARRDLMDALARRTLADEFNMRARAWDTVVHLRDPSEPPYYGRAPITAEVRDRVWQALVAELVRQHGTIEAAESGGLRVCSPMLRTAAPPRPYRRLKRPRGLLTSQRVGLPPLRAATESRTP